LSDEKLVPETHYSVVALTDIVKQTIYMKYQRAIASAKALDAYELRAPRARVGANLSGGFKTDVIDLLLEIKPKAISRKEYADLSVMAEVAFMRPNDVSLEEYKLALLHCGDFLDVIGVTKINVQRAPSGASEVTARI
jgi:hypothetical protein